MFFKLTSFDLTIDTTKFSDDVTAPAALTYSIVGSRNPATNVVYDTDGTTAITVGTCD